MEWFYKVDDFVKRNHWYSKITPLTLENHSFDFEK